MRASRIRGASAAGLAALAMALAFASPAAAVTKTFHGCVTGGVPLPDRSSNALSINVAVPKKLTGLGSIKSIRIGTRIDHTSAGDLALAIVTPDARAFSLSVANGGGGDGYGTGPASGCPASSLVLFDETAALPITSPGNTGNNPIIGSFRPQASFVHLDHSRVFGFWTLLVTDTADLDTGTLTAFSLDITYTAKKAKSKKKKK